ncbi:MAG: Uma2 family endonuclease [Planctomycetales bacterium]|nr:Uma2 family endonuclease [Planctomycetales bacterium]
MASGTPISRIGDPPWEIATLFPNQGYWSEQEYLALGANRRIEFADGQLEFPPMPTKTHQLIVGFLYRAIFGFVAGAGLGDVFLAGYRVKVLPGRFREPDVVVVLTRNTPAAHERFTESADLVVEVVSEDDPARDLETKRTEYAQAGIPEYWIVDPRDRSITVLTLPDGAQEYTEAGRYTEGEEAASPLLAGLAVSVALTFDQE